ncbi:MAG TPA: MerR family transcriptional regulator [Symbiobacteriaceae bacterium]|nr:MerR family transcriptional regulator [Symbiobacteriaceae bacterium]
MYTIGQFARILGVSAKALRFYDSIGLIRPARVNPENQYRYYGRDQVRSMRQVLFLRELGLGLEAIRLMLADDALSDPQRLAAVLQERLAGLHAEIRERQGLVSRLEHVIADLQTNGGAEAMQTINITVKEIPALEVVGVRKRTAVGQNGQLVGEAYAKLQQPPAGRPMTIYHEWEYDPDGMDMEAVLPVATGGEQTLPAVTVASATHVGPYEQIGQTYEPLFAWVSEHGYQIAGPIREVYLVTVDSGKPAAELVTELQVPIMRS